MTTYPSSEHIDWRDFAVERAEWGISRDGSSCVLHIHREIDWPAYHAACDARDARDDADRK